MVENWSSSPILFELRRLLGHTVFRGNSRYMDGVAFDFASKFALLEVSYQFEQIDLVDPFSG